MSNQNEYIYRPQRSCGKVMFSQASVILFAGGCLEDTPLGRHPHGQPTPNGQTPPQQTATAADGTHPTGVHSCLKVFFEGVRLDRFCWNILNKFGKFTRTSFIFSYWGNITSDVSGTFGVRFGAFVLKLTNYQVKQQTDKVVITAFTGTLVVFPYAKIHPKE